MTKAADSGSADFGVRLSLLTLAVVYTLLAIASAAALVFLGADTSLGGAAALNPFGSPELSQRFFSTNAGAVRVSAFFCFASAIPFVIYTTVAVAKLHTVGARREAVYGVFAGGLLASGGLAAAGVLLYALAVPEITASIPVTHALHFLVVLSGGIAFAVGQGLMAAAVSASSRAAHGLPAWIVVLGYLIAVTGILSTFGMLDELMTIPIPVTRIAGFVWLIAVGAHLREETR